MVFYFSLTLKWAVIKSYRCFGSYHVEHKLPIFFMEKKYNDAKVYDTHNLKQSYPTEICRRYEYRKESIEVVKLVI